jgi:hypothetical protein
LCSNFNAIIDLVVDMRSVKIENRISMYPKGNKLSQAQLDLSWFQPSRKIMAIALAIAWLSVAIVRMGIMAIAYSDRR